MTPKGKFFHLQPPDCSAIQRFPARERVLSVVVSSDEEKRSDRGEIRVDGGDHHEQKLAGPTKGVEKGKGEARITSQNMINCRLLGSM